jgi:DNA-binding transcriptional LysR family regulator
MSEGPERHGLTVDPRLLRSFVVLAEELHFGRAAQRLHVAQPAVSQQLQRLEAQVGERLVTRNRQHVELTPAGEAVVPFAQQAVASADAVARVAREAARGSPVTLTIGLSPGAHYFAERVLARFAAERPEIRIRAVADNTGALAREIAAARVAVAFGFASAPAAGVVRTLLREEPAVLAVAHAHPLARRERIALTELAGERFALVDRTDGEGYNAAVVRLCRSAGFEPRTTSGASGPMAWETAVRHGGCVGLTSRASAASTLRGLETVPLEGDASFPIELLTSVAHRADPGIAGDLVEVARRLAGASR